MMVFGMQMKMGGQPDYTATYRKHAYCYVNIDNVSTFRVISADCKTAEGGVEPWTLFMFQMNSSETVVMSVENFTEVNEWLIGNSI